MLNYLVVKMSNNDIFNMYFGIIYDPRCEANITHKLLDILKLVMIAVLCGMDELDKIIDYGNNLKKEFNIESIKSDTNKSDCYVKFKDNISKYCLYINNK